MEIKDLKKQLKRLYADPAVVAAKKLIKETDEEAEKLNNAIAEVEAQEWRAAQIKRKQDWWLKHLNGTPITIHAEVECDDDETETYSFKFGINQVHYEFLVLSNVDETIPDKYCYVINEYEEPLAKFDSLAQKIVAGIKADVGEALATFPKPFIPIKQQKHTFT